MTIDWYLVKGTDNLVGIYSGLSWSSLVTPTDKMKRKQERRFRTWLVCPWHLHFFPRFDKHFTQQTTISSVLCAPHHVPATDRKDLTSSCVPNTFSITHWSLDHTQKDKSNTELSHVPIPAVSKPLLWPVASNLHGNIQFRVGKKWAVGNTLNFSMQRKPQTIHSINNSRIQVLTYILYAVYWLSFTMNYILMSLCNLIFNIGCV